MEDIVKQIMIGVGVSVAFAVLVVMWRYISKWGLNSWTRLGTVELSPPQPLEPATRILKVEGIRLVAVIALSSLVLAFISLIAIALRSQQVTLDVFPGDLVSAIPNPGKDQNYSAEGGCPADSTLINYYCEISGDGLGNPGGDGDLQNLGITVSEKDGKKYVKFRCLWNHIKLNTNGKFVAKGQPVCVRFVRK